MSVGGVRTGMWELGQVLKLEQEQHISTSLHTVPILCPGRIKGTSTSVNTLHSSGACDMDRKYYQISDQSIFAFSSKIIVQLQGRRKVGSR
jgi:hypothetical protein